MDKYIEREIAINRIRKVANMIGFENPAVAIDCTISVLENTPTADVAPVRHGLWGKQDDYSCCSVCGQSIADECVPWFKFCPNCGTIMDLED